MSVKIRLLRSGQKHRPFYKVVVADSRAPRDGRFIEMLGYYDPVPTTGLLKLDTDRVQHWVDRGAIATDTVRALIKKAGTWPTAEDVAIVAREKRSKAIEEANRLGPRKPDAAAPKSERPAAKPAPKAEALEAEVPKAEAPETAPRAAAATPDAPKAEAAPDAPAAAKADAAETTDAPETKD